MALVNVRFFYKNNQHSYKHEIIISSVCNAVAQLIDLPTELEVCLYSLGNNVYGGVDRYKINRLGINYDIPMEELPLILVHELIHVNQKHTGLLRIAQDGLIYWRGIPYTKKLPEELEYSEYEKLPWEIDVENQQIDLLHRAIPLLKRYS